MRLGRIVLVLAILTFVASAYGDEQVVVKNAGFETAGEKGLPADWSGRADVYRRDTTVSRSDGASLKFVNENPKDYVLCSQRIELEPGKMYEFSAWVKTQGVKGTDSGATICVEWQDKDGKYIAGAYPPGKKGDTDWTLIKGVTGRIPERAKRCSITCYLRKGMTGTAWWDDVCVRRVLEDPLSTVLVAPNYRGRISDAGPDHVKIHAEVNPVDYDMPVDDVALSWSVVAEQDQTESARGIVDKVTSNATDLLIPARDLPIGRHRVEVMLTQKRSGGLLANKSHPVVRVTQQPDRAATIDRHNRLILNGRPFFPLGMYWASISKDEIEIYADSPFNCLMPYGAPNAEQMDLAHAHGLKVIYSVKDTYYGTKYCPKGFKSEADELPFIKKKVEAFSRHPALMAWYINDELPLSLLDRLVAHRRWLAELDPGHPTWVVLYQVDHVRRYIETFDVIGTDPYPIPARPPGLAGEWTRKTAQAVGGARPVWMVPQVFNWACYKKGDAADERHRPPTLDEMRSMAWQCIAEGANGLVFYSWFDIRRDKVRPFDEHWADVKTMAGQIKEMTPVLLSVEPPPAVEAEPAEWLHWRVKQLDGKTVLIAVNDSRKPGKARFVLPRRPIRIALHGSDEKTTVDGGNRLQVPFEPLEVRIYEMTGLIGK